MNIKVEGLSSNDLDKQSSINISPLKEMKKISIDFS